VNDEADFSGWPRVLVSLRQPVPRLDAQKLVGDLEKVAENKNFSSISKPKSNPHSLTLTQKKRFYVGLFVENPVVENQVVKRYVVGNWRNDEWRKG
jgi:hypothetical protein